MISRNTFLSTNFPNIAYCSYHRGPSTKFCESFHVSNSNNGLSVNIFWHDDGTVSLGVFNSREESPFKQNTSHFCHEKHKSMKDIVAKLLEVVQ